MRTAFTRKVAFLMRAVFLKHSVLSGPETQYLRDVQPDVCVAIMCCCRALVSCVTVVDDRGSETFRSGKYSF